MIPRAHINTEALAAGIAIGIDLRRKINFEAAHAVKISLYAGNTACIIGSILFVALAIGLNAAAVHIGGQPLQRLDALTITLSGNGSAGRNDDGNVPRPR